MLIRSNAKLETYQVGVDNKEIKVNRSKSRKCRILITSYYKASFGCSSIHGEIFSYKTLFLLLAQFVK